MKIGPYRLIIKDGKPYMLTQLDMEIAVAEMQTSLESKGFASEDVILIPNKRDE